MSDQLCTHERQVKRLLFNQMGGEREKKKQLVICSIRDELRGAEQLIEVS